MCFFVDKRCVVEVIDIFFLINLFVYSYPKKRQEHVDGDVRENVILKAHASKLGPHYR